MKIKLELVPDNFLDRVRKNPQIIFNDFEIRLALDAMRIYAKDGTQSESKEAREVLKKAKLEIFIPDNSHRLKTPDRDARYWQTNPEIFLQAILDMQIKARPIWEKYKYKEKDKSIIAKEMIEELLGKTPDKKFVDRVIGGEKDMQFTNLILSIFAEKFDNDYYSIRNIYYDAKNRDLKEFLLNRKENEYLATEVVAIEQYLDTEINAKKIKENPQLGILAQREAYQAYIWEQYNSKKISSYSFFWKLIDLANEQTFKLEQQISKHLDSI